MRVAYPVSLKNGFVDLNTTKEIKCKTEIDEKKLTREGDIILSASMPYNAAYITKETSGLFVPSFCLLIRIKNSLEIDAKFLTAFINSDNFKEQAKELVSKTTTPMLSVSRLKEVQIPVFDIEKQREISLYCENVQKEEIIMKHIIDLEKEKLNVVLGGI